MLININNNKVEIYDSIQTITIDRYRKYQLYSLMDSSVGTSIQSMQQSIGTAIAKIDVNAEHAKKDLQNIQVAMELVSNNVDPSLLSFAVLVKSINGDLTNDLSEDGLQDVVNRLARSGTTMGKIIDALEEVKKKLRLK